MELLNKVNGPGLIFFADFEKAYDSIDHDFMCAKCLETFNFGENFIKWVKLFFNIHV